MDYKHNKSLLSNAKNLRKNMTIEERHLWYDFLRFYPVKFLRQKILGKYIVDFYCAEAKLIVELDGSQLNSATPSQICFVKFSNSILFLYYIPFAYAAGTLPTAIANASPMQFPLTPVSI